MPHKDPVAANAYWRQKKREYREQGRRQDRDKAWAAAHHANTKALRQGAAGEITADEAFAILAVGSCFYCGKTTDLGLDHVVPMARGGVNRPENIVSACGSCNKRKHQRTVEEWVAGVLVPHGRLK